MGKTGVKLGSCRCELSKLAHSRQPVPAPECCALIAALPPRLSHRVLVVGKVAVLFQANPFIAVRDISSILCSSVSLVAWVLE